MCQSTKSSETGDKTSYENCLAFLLEKVFEMKETDLKELDQFIVALAESKIISGKSFNSGVSKFAQLVSGMATDVPYLCRIFARSVLMPLIEI